MSYRVVNVTTAETVAEFNGAAQFRLAVRLADDLADGSDQGERYIIIQSLTVYETAANTKGELMSPWPRKPSPRRKKPLSECDE